MPKTTLDAERPAKLKRTFAEYGWNKQELIATLVGMHPEYGSGGLNRIVSKFKSLQKVHIPSGPRPTVGQKGDYTLLQVCEVVMCFELGCIGMDPWFIKDQLYRSDNIMAMWAARLADLFVKGINNPEEILKGSQQYVIFKQIISASKDGKMLMDRGSDLRMLMDRGSDPSAPNLAFDRNLTILNITTIARLLGFQFAKKIGRDYLHGYISNGQY